MYLSLMPNRVREMVVALLLVLGASASEVDASTCDAFSLPGDGAYWDEVAQCDSCVAAGCVYCLSTLSCIDAASEQPCPETISSTAACPARPDCSGYSDCESCVADDACAFCAGSSTCYTVSEIFSENCRGTVFDAPCPESFVGVNRVVGNLFVESDETFGGGEFHLDGQSNDGDSSWSMSLAENEFSMTAGAAASVHIAAGNTSDADTSGGSISLTAGNGFSEDRGSGGSISLAAGDAHGDLSYGASTAGEISVVAGRFCALHCVGATDALLFPCPTAWF